MISASQPTREVISAPPQTQRISELRHEKHDRGCRSPCTLSDDLTSPVLATTFDAVNRLAHGDSGTDPSVFAAALVRSGGDRRSPLVSPVNGIPLRLLRRRCSAGVLSCGRLKGSLVGVHGTSGTGQLHPEQSSSAWTGRRWRRRRALPWAQRDVQRGARGSQDCVEPVLRSKTCLYARTASTSTGA